MKKKIFWLTADNFYDTDVHIVPEIANHHYIDWYLFLGHKKSYYENEIMTTTYPNNDNLTVTVHKSKVRARDPRRIREFLMIIKLIKKGKYDIVYIDMFDWLYLFPLLYVYRVKKIVYAVHDVVIHVDDKYGKMSDFMQNFIITRFHNFHIFSEQQYHIFISKYPKKNVFMARMALKDFGKSEMNPPANKIVFTFFGSIRENKGIEYLIEAGNKLHETHHGKYIINIFGFTPEWEKYEKLIQYSEAFNLDIRKIENSEIPDIFCTSHFIVLPYKDVTQSGILHIAYFYSTPAICSDFGGFKEYVEDGVTGFLFQPMDSDDLYRKMKHTIEHFEDYLQIKQNLKNFVDMNCSIDAIVDSYLRYFNHPLL